jgi:hypothetical protein
VYYVPYNEPIGNKDPWNGPGWPPSHCRRKVYILELCDNHVFERYNAGVHSRIPVEISAMGDILPPQGAQRLNAVYDDIGKGFKLSKVLSPNIGDSMQV